jgi:hypothetical protein
MHGLPPDTGMVAPVLALAKDGGVVDYGDQIALPHPRLHYFAHAFEHAFDDAATWRI